MIPRREIEGLRASMMPPGFHGNYNYGSDSFMQPNLRNFKFSWSQSDLSWSPRHFRHPPYRRPEGRAMNYHYQEANSRVWKWENWRRESWRRANWKGKSWGRRNWNARSYSLKERNKGRGSYQFNYSLPPEARPKSPLLPSIGENNGEEDIDRYPPPAPRAYSDSDDDLPVMDRRHDADEDEENDSGNKSPPLIGIMYHDGDDDFRQYYIGRHITPAKETELLYGPACASHDEVLCWRCVIEDKEPPETELLEHAAWIWRRKKYANADYAKSLHFIPAAEEHGEVVDP